MTPLCTLLKSGSDVLVQTFTVLVYRPSFLGYHLFIFITTLAFVSLFANISNCTGLDVKKEKITNHSSRCTALSNMTRIGIQEQELIKITGHSFASSLKPFLQINDEHHSEILMSGERKRFDRNLKKSKDFFFSLRGLEENIPVHRDLRSIVCSRCELQAHRPHQRRTDLTANTLTTSTAILPNPYTIPRRQPPHSPLKRCEVLGFVIHKLFNRINKFHVVRQNTFVGDRADLLAFRTKPIRGIAYGVEMSAFLMKNVLHIYFRI
ncbi:hypothetical protein ANN_26503 [Periplaneta americana]|uniref:Uncharacterized protein n=1 Tax=Periplaneta americana TaxID=6978 RepID=A0ABQ8RYS4_PERAM|nr:hypothetical protein ANN_26503 [Periplaneta americana]